MKIVFYFKVLMIAGILLALNGCQTVADNDEATKKLNAAKINDQLGMAYLERHDPQRAKQKFLLALEQAPSLPEAWYSMAYFLESTGNSAEAKQHYLKAVALAPDRGDVLNNYGTFLCRKGENKEAITYFLKAAKDSKYLDIAGAYENAGLCSAKMRQNKAAKTYFIKALTEDSRRPTSMIELAEIYYTEGRFKDSRNALNQFLKISSPTVQSYRLERKLETS